MTVFPKSQSWFVRAREQLRVKYERVPFNEEDAEPFKEKAGFVLGLFHRLLGSPIYLVFGARPLAKTVFLSRSLDNHVLSLVESSSSS